MKVLIIDDNVRLCERIEEKLRKSFNFESAYTGSDGIALAESSSFDVIVLDIGLPDIDGLTVCRKIRASNNHTPIMILTGNKDTESKVALLGDGADDYLGKPFELSEFDARLKALSRRQSRKDRNDVIMYKDLKIDVDKREVTREGVPIYLRRKEFDILHYLLQNVGRIMTREMIIAYAWNNSSNTWVNTVDVHIKHIRDKIDKPFTHKYIKTCYGLGYKVEQ